MRIIGSRFAARRWRCARSRPRRSFPHTWIDLEDDDDIDVLLASMGVRPVDTPVVITPTAVLRHPTPGEFAEHLGLTFQRPPGYMFDLVVVGTGPAGLAAAVYGASEGLDTVSLDAVDTVVRPARARASRTTSGSRTGSPARTSSRVPRSRPNDSAPG